MKVPPLNLNTPKHNVDIHSEMAHEKFLRNDFRDTATPLEYSSEDKNAPIRISKKLRMEMRLKSSSSNQGNR